MSHPEEEFEKNNVPVLDARKIDLKMINEFAVIDRDVLNRKLKTGKLRQKNGLKKRKNISSLEL